VRIHDRCDFLKEVRNRIVLVVLWWGEEGSHLLLAAGDRSPVGLPFPGDRGVGQTGRIPCQGKARLYIFFEEHLDVDVNAVLKRRLHLFVDHLFGPLSRAFVARLHQKPTSLVQVYGDASDGIL